MPPTKPTGIVYLIGAGPGDPGLITVRGIERLKQAEVVVYDRLANHSLLAHARQAELIDVGKQPDRHPVPQAEINALLVEKARAKRRFPNTLLLEVVETIPVALIPNPALEPVDGSGRFLPIDPAEHRLDLPIVGLRESKRGVTLSAAERRLLAGEIARLGVSDPDLVARISEVRLDARGDLWAQLWRQNSQGELWDLPVTLRFRPSLPGRRFQEGMRVLDDAMNRFEGAVVADLDLRFEEQVVVRLNKVRGN